MPFGPLRLGVHLMEKRILSSIKGTKERRGSDNRPGLMNQRGSLKFVEKS